MKKKHNPAVYQMNLLQKKVEELTVEIYSAFCIGFYRSGWSTEDIQSAFNITGEIWEEHVRNGISGLRMAEECKKETGIDIFNVIAEKR